MDLTKKRIESRGMHFVDFTRRIDGHSFCIWMQGYPKEILMRIGPLNMIQGTLMDKLAEKIAKAHKAVFETTDLGGYTESKSPALPAVFVSDKRKVFTVKMKEPDWGPYSGKSETKEGQQEIQEVKERLITIVEDFFQITEKAAEFIMNL